MLRNNYVNYTFSIQTYLFVGNGDKLNLCPTAGCGALMQDVSDFMLMYCLILVLIS